MTKLIVGYIRRLARKIRRKLIGNSLARIGLDNVVGQKALMHYYSDLPPEARLSFRNVGFGLYSQHDEDGILLYLMSRIGPQSYKCIEICAGNGIECNTANLLINHRWTGLLIDGSAENIANAKEFYLSRAETRHWPPTCLQVWLTKDNVNKTIIDAGFSGDVDVLSIDVDGMDYWIWEALDVVLPRVVVLEYNHILGPEAAITVPYDPNFVAEFTEYGTDYAGASLGAFIKLGNRKGYRFVGANAIGTNAFFVRNDIAERAFPAADPASVFVHPRAQFGVNVRAKKVLNKSWIDV